MKQFTFSGSFNKLKTAHCEFNRCFRCLLTAAELRLMLCSPQDQCYSVVGESPVECSFFLFEPNVSFSRLWKLQKHYNSCWTFREMTLLASISL